MYYETFEDYLIDNRNAIAHNIRHMSMDELKDEVLSAYDFGATEAIKHLECYKLLKAAVIARYGQKAFDDLEAATSKDFTALMKAEDKYYTDIKNHRKVGYSEDVIKWGF